MDWNTKIPSRFISTSDKTQPSTDYGIGVKKSQNGDTREWKRINENGDEVTALDSYFDTHRVYSQIENVEVDYQTDTESFKNVFVYIPKFYIKTDTNKSSIWINYAEPDDDTAKQKLLNKDYVLHPAFYSNGEEIPGNGIYIGKYQASFIKTETEEETTGIVKSYAGDYPSCTSFDEYKKFIDEDTNKDPDKIVYHMMTIYEYHAIALLFLIEYLSTDAQKILTNGKAVTESIVKNNDLSFLTDYRGLIGLFGNVWQYIDGLFVDSDYYINIFKETGKTKDESYCYSKTSGQVPSKGFDEESIAVFDENNSGFFKNVLESYDSATSSENKYDFRKIFIPDCGSLTQTFSSNTYSDMMYGSTADGLDYYAKISIGVSTYKIYNVKFGCAEGGVVYMYTSTGAKANIGSVSDKLVNFELENYETGKYVLNFSMTDNVFDTGGTVTIEDGTKVTYTIKEGTKLYSGDEEAGKIELSKEPVIGTHRVAVGGDYLSTEEENGLFAIRFDIVPDDKHTDSLNYSTRLCKY